jgi:hypothetical protein
MKKKKSIKKKKIIGVAVIQAVNDYKIIALRSDGKLFWSYSPITNAVSDWKEIDTSIFPTE